MIIVDVEQGSPEWWQARLGVPTASEFDSIVTPPDYRDKWGCGNEECNHIAEGAAVKCKKGNGKAVKYQDIGMTQSASMWGYMDKLIAERHRGKPDETFQSEWMKRGNEFEEEARLWYAFTQDAELRKVGFCKTDDEQSGCSPDALIGEDGGLEIKSVISGTMVGYVLDNRIPPKYRLQVLGSLLVTGRLYWDFLVYHPDFKPLLIRTWRKDVQKELSALTTRLDVFCTELHDRREQFKQRMAA